MAQTIQERRLQFHASRVDEFLDPLNPHVNTFLEQAREFFYQQTGDPAGSQQRAVQALENLRQQQAESLAYFDVFWVAAVLGVALAFLVLLMKRSVAEKGAHVGAE
jgi:DHA2 family multidrug resistance protein